MADIHLILVLDVHQILISWKLIFTKSYYTNTFSEEQIILVVGYMVVCNDCEYDKDDK